MRNRVPLEAGSGCSKECGEEIVGCYIAELGDYFKNFGDCNVPENWPINRPLARWVVQPRKLRRAKRLPPEQERRLANLGFEWGISDANWERMLAMLAEFAREHDHCRVPSKWKDNPISKAG